MKPYITVHRSNGAWWGRVYLPKRWRIDALPYPTLIEALIAVLSLYRSANPHLED